MIITSLYTNIAASFKSSYNGRVPADLTIWHFTKWLGTSDPANTARRPLTRYYDFELPISSDDKRNSPPGRISPNETITELEPLWINRVVI